MSDSVLQRQTFQAGDRIFKEGDEGFLAYIVQSGEVEIFKNINGVEKILGTVGKGGIFGEMALIDSKPRMAGARAKKGSTVILVNRATFDKKLAKADPFIRGLLNILVNNVRALS